MLALDRVTEYARNPESFWRDVEIERADGQIISFGVAGADFQWDFLRSVAPALLRIQGFDIQPEHFWFWEQRVRGASKSSDAVLALLHPLCFSPRPLRTVIIASDLQQGRVFIHLARKMIALNPLIESRVEVLQSRLRNSQTGTEIEIMSSDTASFYGQLVDALVCDEVVLWPDNGLWEAAISTMAKKSFAVLLCLSNAGWVQSWSYSVFQEMRSTPHCRVSVMQGVPPWISDRHLEAQRRLLPQLSFNRLWGNMWVAGSQGGLDPADIEAACILPGPMPYSQPGRGYISGLDFGRHRHHSSLAVLASNYAENRVELADLLDWAPQDGPGGKVSFDDVRRGILAMKNKYRLKSVFYDRWQLEQLADELTRSVGLQMVPVLSAGEVASQQATGLLTAFRDKRFVMYPHELLLKDLHGCSIIERPTGFKVMLAETPDGHSDRLAAMLNCLPISLEALSYPPVDYGDGLGSNLLNWKSGMDRWNDKYEDRLRSIQSW